MNGMLLCAGLGTRFRPHTNKMPKPSLPFLTVPLMGYSLYLLEQMGVQSVTINTHHLPHIVENVARQLTHGQNYKLNISPEPKEILGSGGGIYRAHTFLETDDDFIVINGDEIVLFNHAAGLKPLLEHHKKHNALATLLTTTHPEAGISMGGVWSEKGFITRLGERAKNPEDAKNAEHFTGIFIFSKRIFDFMPHQGPSHIFKDALIPAIEKGETVLSYCDKELYWLDTSSEADYIQSTRKAMELLGKTTPHAECLKDILFRFNRKFEQVAEKKYFCQGATYSGSLKSAATVFLGPNAVVHPGVQVRGFAVLGESTHFHNGVIEDSVIAHGLHVHEMVALRNQLLV